MLKINYKRKLASLMALIMIFSAIAVYAVIDSDGDSHTYFTEQLGNEYISAAGFAPGDRRIEVGGSVDLINIDVSINDTSHDVLLKRYEILHNGWVIRGHEFPIETLALTAMEAYYDMLLLEEFPLIIEETEVEPEGPEECDVPSEYEGPGEYDVPVAEDNAADEDKDEGAEPGAEESAEDEKYTADENAEDTEVEAEQNEPAEPESEETEGAVTDGETGDEAGSETSSEPEGEAPDSEDSSSGEASENISENTSNETTPENLQGYSVYYGAFLPVFRNVFNSNASVLGNAIGFYDFFGFWYWQPIDYEPVVTVWNDFEVYNIYHYIENLLYEHFGEYDVVIVYTVDGVERTLRIGSFVLVIEDVYEPMQLIETTSLGITRNLLTSGIVTELSSNLPWRLYDCGTLEIGTGTIEISTTWNNFNSPWTNNHWRDIRYVVFTGSVIAINSLYGLFGNLPNLVSIEGLYHLDTSNVWYMGGIFAGAGSLTNLDLSNFDTSNATDMRYMFSGARSLASLDLSSFDTSNVTTMIYMFSHTSSLTSLDLSSFDTSNVGQMMNMFSHTSSLTSLDLSGFDTSNLWDMRRMFWNASSLTILNLSSFDISNANANMWEMFAGANSLNQLTLGQDFQFRTHHALPAGPWINVGTGTPHAPQGTHTFNSNDPIGIINSIIFADTWVRYPFSPPPTPPTIQTQSLPNAIRFVPYNTVMRHTGGTADSVITWFIPYGAPSLPPGLTLSPNGEIRGTPTTEGVFLITIGMRSVTPGRPDVTVTGNFQLTVLPNTPGNIENLPGAGPGQGYGLIVRLPDLITVAADHDMVSEGPFAEFVGVLLNGERLVRDVDYTAGEASTRVTIRAQTFERLPDGQHTIVMEFRDAGGQYHHAGQNFELRLVGRGTTPGSNQPESPSSPAANQPRPPTPSAANQPGQPAAAVAAPAGPAEGTARTGTVTNTPEGQVMDFQFPHGTVTFDAAAMQSLAEQELDEDVTVTFDIIDFSSLTQGQQEALSENHDIYRITAASGDNSITQVDGNIYITVTYNGPTPVSAWRLASDNIMEPLETTFDEAAGTVEFITSRLSLFAVGYEYEEQQETAAADTAPVPTVGQLTMIRLAIDETTFTNNGQQAQADAAPFIDPATNRTMVPLRLVAEALGAQVNWNADIRTVTITLGGQTLSMLLDEPLPDGMGVPMISNGRTFVPIAYVAQMLGADTLWDGYSRAVYIQR